MAYLKLDGLTIPVVSSAPGQKYDDIGSLQRSVSGRGLYGIRANRRSWDVVTPPMAEADAEALVRIIQGGLYFSFDSVPYSTSGYLPVTSDVTYAASGKAGSGALELTAGDDMVLVDATHTPFASGYDAAWSLSVWLYGTSGTTGDIYYASAAKLLQASTADVTWKAAGLTLNAGSGLRGGSSLWDHVVCVLYRSETDTKTYAELWLNGAMVDSDSTAAAYTFPDLGSETSVYIGTDSAGATMFTGKISQLVFVPGRLTSRWISALANSNAGVTLGLWPKRLVSGDIISNRSSVQCHVLVTGSEPRQLTLSGSFANNARALALTLVEV